MKSTDVLHERFESHEKDNAKELRYRLCSRAQLIIGLEKGFMLNSIA